MVAIELVKPGVGDGRVPDPDLTKRIQAEALARKLIVLTAGTYVNVIRIIPPLVTTAAEVDLALVDPRREPDGRRRLTAMRPVGRGIVPRRSATRPGTRRRRLLEAVARAIDAARSWSSSATRTRRRRGALAAPAPRDAALGAPVAGGYAARRGDRRGARDRRSRSFARGGFSGTWAVTDMAVSVSRAERSRRRGGRVRGGGDGRGRRGPGRRRDARHPAFDRRRADRA